MLQFTTSSEYHESGSVKMLVYSQAGMGKTVLTATLPSPILISAESGALSLKRQNLERIFGVETGGICYNIPMIVINSMDDLVECYNWALQSPEAAQFQSIALDSISEIGEVVLSNAKKTSKDPRQAYGELIEQMTRIIRSFRDLPKNVYMTCKMDSAKDELTGVTKYGPSLPGAKLSKEIGYFFDEVFRIGVNKDEQGVPYRFLQTQPDIQYEAKDRSGALSAIEYPHLGHIIGKITQL